MRHVQRLSRYALTTLALASSAQAVDFGQLDDFQNGTNMGWDQGVNSPTPTTVMPNGGPAGAGDKYLVNVSNGIGGAGSKQVMFNGSEWGGNFVSAHVTRIVGQLANFGTSTLYMRIALRGSNFEVASSKTPAILPADGLWHPVTFDLTSQGMDSPFGGSFTDIESDVLETRMLSSEFGGTFIGDTVEATLGMDNLRATTLTGDATFDNQVNSADFTALATAFGTSSPAWVNGDFNFDGAVNALDFNLLAAHYGESISLDPPALGTLVPEPAMACGFLAFGLLARDRRKHSP